MIGICHFFSASVFGKFSRLKILLSGLPNSTVAVKFIFLSILGISPNPWPGFAIELQKVSIPTVMSFRWKINSGIAIPNWALKNSSSCLWSGSLGFQSVCLSICASVCLSTSL